MNFQSKLRRALTFGSLLPITLCIAAEGSSSKTDWSGSPLAGEVQVQLERAGKLMKTGKYDKAKPMIQSSLASANDVPKCLAIAEFTEPYGFPMMDLRRECCNKALSLCSSEQDYLLMALKARHYQFYEITRQAISNLTENARTVPQLYELAKKAHEVSLNDVAHMALEKAATGIKTAPDWLTYAETCKSLGLDDLLRKAVKLLIDQENDSVALCEIALRVQRYAMRDELRYCLTKALDKVSSDLPTATHEMAEIAETARQVNEPDVKLRADFFVKKGTNMLRQRGEQAETESRIRAEREHASLDDARIKERSGFSTGQGADGQGAGGQTQAAPGNPSSGY